MCPWNVLLTLRSLLPRPKNRPGLLHCSLPYSCCSLRGIVAMYACRLEVVSSRIEGERPVCQSSHCRRPSVVSNSGAQQGYAAPPFRRVTTDVGHENYSTPNTPVTCIPAARTLPRRTHVRCHPKVILTDSRLLQASLSNNLERRHKVVL